MNRGHFFFIPPRNVKAALSEMSAALIPSPGASPLLALEGRGHPSEKDLFLPGSRACRAVASLALAMEQIIPGNQ